MQSDPVPPASAHPALPAKVGWPQIWMLLILTLAVVLAFADRALLAILVDPIKQDLHVTDLQMSYLLGLSFSIVYSLAAIPLGYLVDVVNRRTLIAICILTWSLMTAYAGFAHTFAELFVARMGLGIAEAALNPAAFAMIRDSFPLNKRARAFALFNSSHLVGGGGALLAGGALLGFASSGGLHGVPILENLRPWQFVLVTIGFIGLPLGLVLFTVREPARMSAPAAAGTSDKPSFAEAFRFIGRKKAILLPFWGGLALFAMAQGGVSAWTPMVVHRTWDVAIPMVGKFLGPLQMVLAVVASLTMGSIMDWLSRKGRRDAASRTCAIAMVLAAAAAFSQLFITDLRTAAVVYIIQIFLFTSYTVASSTSLAQITPTRLAGKLQAITGLASSLLGLALGPTVVALVSAKLFKGPNALHDGMTATVGTVVVLGAILFTVMAAQMRRDRDAQN
jgi:MFS family permease